VTTSDGYKLAKLEPAEAEKRIEQLKKEAPRLPGRKRRASGEKVKAIVDKGAKKRRKASAEPDAIEAGTFARSESAIAKKRAWVAEHLKIPGQDKLCMEMVFAWLGGDDEAFIAWEESAAQ
jgi:phage terminase small subunit